MENLLNKIINKVETNEQDSNKPKFEANFNVNPLKDKFLNNLDGIDENVGNFNIKVFGIGGAGCNVIKYMKEARVWADNVQIYALNTDVTSLRKISNLSNVYLLGKTLLRGAGSGGDPLIGKTSVEEDRDAIKQVLQGTDLLFLVAGLGKGTGSGATPEIAKIAKEMGILTVAVVNLPSITAEGNTIYTNALNNLKELKKQVNSITTISNDLIIKNSGMDISFMRAFEKANEQVTTIIGEVADMINNATEMNIDFADLKNFFVKCPVFNANAFNLDQDYSLTNLKNKISKCIEASYTDIKLDNAQEVIVNLKINESTPPTIISDVRTIFKGLSSNNELSVVAGVDYTNLKNIRVSFLISTKEDSSSDESNLEDEIISFTKINNEQESKIEFGNEIPSTKVEVKEDNTLDQYKSSSNTHKTFINKERFNFDENNTIEEEPNNYLNSDECVDIITKAMTGVLRTTAIVFPNEKEIKNN